MRSTYEACDSVAPPKKTPRFRVVQRYQQVNIVISTRGDYPMSITNELTPEEAEKVGKAILAAVDLARKPAATEWTID